MFLFRKSQPYIDLLSPLPLGECLLRLRGISGRNADGTAEVTINQTELDQCSFQVRVQRARRGLFDLTVYGMMNRESATTTQVLIATGYTQNLAVLWLITVLTVIMGVIMVMISQNLYLMALPIAVVVVLYFLERNNYGQVVEMIRAALELSQGEKVKNSEVA